MTQPTATHAGIQTATGPSPLAALGATLFGEHVVSAPAGHGYWPVDQAGRAARLAVSVEALRSLQEFGIGTIVDTTPIEEGRDLDLIRETSEGAGVAVVCSTGLSAASGGVAAAFRSLTAPRLADVYITELADGVPGSGVRTGAITVAFGDSDPFDATALLATAFAHAETGAPVLLAAPSEQLESRVDALMARGVDPVRIIARGLDAPTTTWAVVDGVARRGVRLGFCSIGDPSLDEGARAALVAYAIRRYGPERVCLGTGAPGSRIPIPGAAVDEADPGSAQERLSRFASQLETFGVSSDELREVLAAGAAPLFSPPADLT